MIAFKAYLICSIAQNTPEFLDMVASVEFSAK